MENNFAEEIKGNIKYDLKAIDSVTEEHAEHLADDIEKLIDQKIHEAIRNDN